MMVLSFNAFGVGGAPKIQALKRLVHACALDFIVIQETLCVGDKAMDAFKLWLRDWSFCTIDSIDMLGGLLSTWSPRFRVVFIWNCGRFEGSFF
jgi:hypothetical protein